ncbi:hypothetical protein [Streptomyces phaeochromogenes]
MELVDRALIDKGVMPGKFWAFYTAFPHLRSTSRRDELLMCACVEWDASRLLNRHSGLVWLWDDIGGWRAGVTRPRDSRPVKGSLRPLSGFPIYAAPSALADVAEALAHKRRLPEPEAEQQREWEGAATARAAVDAFRSSGRP